MSHKPEHRVNSQQMPSEWNGATVEFQAKKDKKTQRGGSKGNENTTHALQKGGDANFLEEEYGAFGEGNGGDSYEGGHGGKGSSNDSEERDESEDHGTKTHMLKLTAFVTISDKPSESEPDEEEPVYQIKFSYPINGAIDKINYPSTIGWDTFHYKIAEKIVTAVGKLNLSYQFSMEPATKKPCILTRPQHFLNLLESAVGYITKMTKTHLQKPYKVLLIQQEIQDQPGAAITKNGKALKSHRGPLPSKDKVTGGQHSLKDLPNGSIISLLEEKYNCDEKDHTTCWILKSGKCHHFLIPHLSLWAMVIKQGVATIHIPPCSIVSEASDYAPPVTAVQEPPPLALSFIFASTWSSSRPRFAQPLAAQVFGHLNEIGNPDFTKEDLLCACDGITLGTANALLLYA
ncbi:hypothetical protein JAAARDRAFT_51581 [Jaapia argillacea MUCL 33604]|uniref:Uncharacterized protein n=1 Tax=Jaapia argillacea MUCL 33604 TaxID=933084 RepID=A0A067PFI8_9AGAM|nr:hypothetical protein JAAARDRAFT_51581 [Jaapia argillacea MUCL 33604]